MLTIFIFILVIILSLLTFITNTRMGIMGGMDKSHIRNPKKTYRLFITESRQLKGASLIYPRKLYEYLIKTLDSLGWEETNNDKYADFIFSLNYYIIDETKTREHFFSIKSDLKSALRNMNSLTKYNLAANAKKSSHFAPTYALKSYKWDGNIVIVKDIYSGQQAGVYVIVDEGEFNSLKKRLLSNNKKASVSLYIKNPLLFKGKKFHLRILVYIFVERRGENISPSLHKKILYEKSMIEINTAKKEYVIMRKEDYLDKDMNISGGSYTDDLYVWPKDFKASEKVDDAFIHKCNKSIHEAIHSINLDKIDLYSEQNAGFHVFGADIMLDDTGHAYILELNNSPGYYPPKISDEQFEKYNTHYFTTLFKWLLDDIILPYFSKG